jgi:hypothetical protein
MLNAVQTTHNLDFEIANWETGLMVRELIGDDPADKYFGIPWKLFRVGTCTGQWRLTPEAYEILSIINDTPNNGHLEDVLEWFEYACKRSKLPLRIRAFTNEKFKMHLIGKREFVPFGEDVQKYFHIKEAKT